MFIFDNQKYILLLMATNKHASIRYQALDRCFRNLGRKFFIEDLIEECNQAIYQYAGIEDGVKKRQVQDDIKYMESEASSWSISLLRHRDGKRVYYRYEDINYSINNQPISQQESIQLKETILMLNRFKGMPQFEWMQELLTRLEDSFQLKGTTERVVGFEENPYLKGLHFFSDLFNAIVNKQTLRIRYKRYEKDEKEFVFYPYFLKQYNNRWFLFGLNPEYQSIIPITNLALDRIQQIELENRPFIENKDIDFDEYFDDVVGVTIYEDKKVEKIILKVEKSLLPYIETKPLHGSQKLVKIEDGTGIIELSLKMNYELESLLLSYADRLNILEPLHLKETITQRAKQIIQKNL